MNNRLKTLYNYLNSRKCHYDDFIKYEMSFTNYKSADILDARREELHFVINELLRIINQPCNEAPKSLLDRDESKIK